MTHCHVLRALVLVAALAAVAGAQTPTRLESVLPEGSGLVLLVEDVSTFRDAWPGSPFGKLWRDPAFREESRKPAQPDSLPFDRVRQATGLSLLEVLDSFEGQVAFCVPDLAALVAAEGDWAVVAASAEDAPWRRLEERMRPPQGRAPLWAWSEGVGYLASSPAYLGVLTRARAESGSHFEDSALLGDLATRTAGGDVSLFVDLRGVRDLAMAGLAATAMDDSAAAGFMGISPEAVVNALGLEAFRGFRVSGSLSPGETVADAGLLVDDRPGVSRLFAYLPGPCRRPRYIPEDALFASVSRYRVGDFYDALLQILDAISPGLSGVIALQMQAIAGSSGVDFQRDLLDRLGDDTWSAYLPRTISPADTSFWDVFDQLSGIGVQDTAAVGTALAALLGNLPVPTAGPVESRDVDGVAVHTLRFAPGGATPEGGFSYAFVDSQLLVAMGEAAILERALGRARGSDRSLWDRPDLAPLFDAIPAEACAIAYWDPAGFARAVAAMPDPPEANAARAVERYLGPAVASTVKTPEGYFTRIRLLHPGR